MPKCPSDDNARVLISISLGALTTAAAPAQTHIHHLAVPIAEVATRLEED